MSQDGNEKNLEQKNEPDVNGEGLDEISGGQGTRENIHPDTRIQHIKSS